MFIDPYMANVTVFAGNFAPRGWMFCNGQLLSISQYDALYALIGTFYGGDGQTTFALPDLRSRVAVSTGQGPGMSSYQLGQTGGNESVTILSNQLAQHTHALISLTGAPAASSAPGITDTPGNTVVPAQINGSPAAYSTAPSATLGNGTITAPTPAVGGSLPVNVLSPVLAMNYIICVEGIFPSRN
ncbi:MAG: tail fiber protein [Bacteroidota bacterium]|nr:tail fiber protein [Bacteroidota bacterium]